MSTMHVYRNSATAADAHGMHGETPPVYQILLLLDNASGTKLKTTTLNWFDFRMAKYRCKNSK